MTHDAATHDTLPPPCPMCARPTAFKEMHKNAKGGSFTCVFRCAPCALDYPRIVGAEALLTVARIAAALKPKGGEGLA
jgi:hypothetical protein